MKEFNLKAAQAGHPLMTRDGRKATYIGYAPDADPGHRVVIHVEGDIAPLPVNEFGMFRNDGSESKRDVFLAPRTMKLWLNVYPAARPTEAMAYGYTSEQSAHNAAGGARCACVPVEIELPPEF